MSVMNMLPRSCGTPQPNSPPHNARVRITMAPSHGVRRTGAREVHVRVVFLPYRTHEGRVWGCTETKSKPISNKSGRSTSSPSSPTAAPRTPRLGIPARSDPRVSDPGCPRSLHGVPAWRMREGRLLRSALSAGCAARLETHALRRAACAGRDTPNADFVFPR